MKTTAAREARRLANYYARKDAAAEALAKRIAAMMDGIIRPDIRIGPGKRSCVVEMRRIEQKREAHLRRIAAGRWANGMEPTVYNTGPNPKSTWLGLWLHRAT